MTPAGLCTEAAAQVYSPEFSFVDAALVRQVRAAKLKIIPWTVNETADMERLIDRGVHGLITDRPDRLRLVMAQRGMPLPPVVAPVPHLTALPP